MIVVMVVIFSFSAMQGEDSGKLSGSLLEMIIGGLVRIFHGPISDATIAHWHNIFRKCAHFTEFMCLGITAVVAFYNGMKSGWRNLLLPILFGVLYAISDEVHQIFVPGRGCAATDVFIDSCGVVTGVLIALLVAVCAKEEKE